MLTVKQLRTRALKGFVGLRMQFERTPEPIIRRLQPGEGGASLDNGETVRVDDPIQPIEQLVSNLTRLLKLTPRDERLDQVR
jgi:hypothetical protein